MPTTQPHRIRLVPAKGGKRLCQLGQGANRVEYR
jgi:hypothetical protein